MSHQAEGDEARESRRQLFQNADGGNEAGEAVVQYEATADTEHEVHGSCSSFSLAYSGSGLVAAILVALLVSWRMSGRYAHTHVPVYSDSGEKTGVWVLHKGLACEVGWGAGEAPAAAAEEAVAGSLEACRDQCWAEDSCDGVSFLPGDSGGCKLRWEVDTSLCMKDSSQDFWYLWRFQEAVPAGVDTLPREEGSSQIEELPHVVFDTSGAGRASADAREGVKPLSEGAVDAAGSTTPVGEGGRAASTTKADTATSTQPVRSSETTTTRATENASATQTVAGEAQQEWKLHRRKLCKGAKAKGAEGQDISLMQCREECVQDKSCKAIQTLSGKLFGQCLLSTVEPTSCDADDTFDLWERVEVGQGNIWKFRPVDGGKGRECVAVKQTYGDSPPFEIHEDTSLDSCKMLCRKLKKCRGIQHDSDQTRCQVWSRSIGSSSERDGSSCFRYDGADALPIVTTTTATTTTASTTSSTTTTPAIPTTTTEACPACSPQERPKPAIVIPTFERDICKMKFTAKSIVKHDAEHVFGDVHVLWVTEQPTSDFEDELGEIRAIIEENRGFKLHDFSGNLAGKGGWFAQQVFKLKIANLLEEDYYILLDSKNTFIRDVKAESFFNHCNVANVFAEYEFNEIPAPHNEWYRKSAEVLHLDINKAGDERWPASITPMTMHRQTVLDMLQSLGEDPSPFNICGGPLCDVLDEGATEFTLYMLYSRIAADYSCVHHTMTPGWKQEIAISLWRGFDGSFGLLEDVANKVRRPVMFGSQASALDGLEPDKASRVPELLKQVFGDAGLLNDDGEISDCIIASGIQT